MSKIRIELNKKGVGEILKSDEMKAICKEHADAIKGRCGSGYKSNAYVKGTRATANVKAVTKRAIKDCMENDTILKAVRK